MERWINRVALVTGASFGVGAAICKELVKYGINVVGCATDVQKIEEMAQSEEVVASSGKLHALKCDMSQETEILAMFEKIKKQLGRIDICINNADLLLPSPLMNGNTSDWRRIIEVNILGTCICTREALKLMNEKKVEDGVIIQMGSIFGQKMACIQKGSNDPSFAIYNGTKLMIRGLAEAVRQELKSQTSRIRVSTIIPGAVGSELLKKSSESEMETTPPTKNLECLQPQDIADAVVYILKCPSHVIVDDVVVQSVDFHV